MLLQVKICYVSPAIETLLNAILNRFHRYPLFNDRTCTYKTCSSVQISSQECTPFLCRRYSYGVVASKTSVSWNKKESQFFRMLLKKIREAVNHVRLGMLQQRLATIPHQVDSLSSDLTNCIKEIKDNSCHLIPLWLSRRAQKGLLF